MPQNDWKVQGQGQPYEKLYGYEKYLITLLSGLGRLFARAVDAVR